MVCFCYDGCIREWLPGDLPRVVHARFFSECVWVQLVKGDQFILSCLSERPPEDGELAAAGAQERPPVMSAPGSLQSQVPEEGERPNVCKICMDGELGVTFLPCGHLTTCAMCAPSLDKCPLCRSRIEALVRAFLT